MPDRRAIRYQFNWAFFSLSMGLLVVIAGLGYLWHAREVSRLAQSWLMRAAELQQQQQYQEAVQYLSRYINLRPNDPEGHVRMATAFDQLAQASGQTSTAIPYFYRALGFQPERIDLRQRLAELLLDQRRFADAAGAARTILQSQAGDPQALRILSLALYFPARTDAGAAWPGVLEALIAAQKANPTEVQLAECTADVYRNRLRPARPEEADRVMDQVVEASKHSGSALLARSMYRRQYKLRGDDDDLTAALQGNPQDPRILLAAAESARQQRRWDEARNLYSSLTKVDPHDPRGFAGLGEIYREQKDFETALKTWQSGLVGSGQESRNGLEMLWELGPRIADLLIDQRRLEDADKQLKTLETTLQKVRARLTPQSVQALNRQNDYLRAKWWMAQNRAQPALTILERLGEPATAPAEGTFNLVSPTQVQWLLAGALASVGQWDQSAVIHERVISLQPNAMAPRLAAANAWLMAGQIDTAIRHFDLLMSQPQVPQEAWRSYSQALLQQQLRLPAAQRNWLALEQALARWPDQGTKAWQKQLLQSKYCAALAQPEQALAALRQAEQSAADDEAGLHDVALAFEELHQPMEADRVFQSWEKIAQQPVAKALFRAELFSLRGDDPQASAILEAAEATLPEADRWTVQHRLAQMQARVGKLKEARQTLAELVAHQPENIQVLQELAELALDAHDLNDAEHWEHQLHALEGENGSLWRWCRARRLLQVDGPGDSVALAEAQRLTNELESRRPAWPDTYVLRGQLAERLGNLAEAVAAFRKAIALGDRRSAISERLVSHLYEMGQFDEAWQILSQAQNPADSSDAMSSLAIAVSLREREMDRAVGLAADWVQRHPDDPNGYLWLGQSQLLSKHTAEAERAFSHATELAPHELRYWQALFRFYLQTEQHNAARETLAKLGEQVPFPEAQKPLVLGECWEALGDLPQAEALYRSAAQAAPEDSAIQQRLAAVLLRLHRPEANEVLEHLESTVKSDDASRNLAKLLATRGDLDSMNKALKLLDQLDVTHEQAELDRRLRAVLLFRRGRAEDRHDAEQLLASLVDDPRNGQPADRLILSKLYEADGLVQAARDQLQALASRAQPDLSYLAVYADFLLRHGDTDQAERWIQRMDEAAPGNFTAVALRVRWLNAQHRTVEIETLVEAAATRELAKLTSDAAKGQFSLAVGELYSTVGLIDPALKYYRQAYGLSPVLYAPLVSVLATHQQTAEAVKICRDVLRTKPTAQPAITLATAMTAGNVAPEELQLAEPILSEALEQYGDDLVLPLAVAGVHQREGNLDDAMQLYRRVLARDPKNLMALNNLSWLLAEQPDHLVEALSLIDRALEQDAHQPNLLDTKAMILFQQGQFPMAATLLDEVVAKPASDARYRFHRALVYERMHDLNRARESLSAAQSSGLNPAQLTPTEKKLLAELEQAVAVLGIRTGPELTSERYTMKDPSVRTLRSLFVLILAGAITLTAAILHGRWTNRWNPPEALSAAAQVLERLPGNFGPWQLVNTEELSPNVRGILQCRDYRQANYENRDTGEKLLLTLLLGPPGPMSVHTPEVCYTSIDSQALAPRQRIELPTSGSPDAVWMVQFHELHEAQSGITRVYYAWSDGAGWSADEEPRVTFGGRPFLFKVQVCVRLPEGSEADTHDPARAFFPVFFPAFAQAAAGLRATDAK